jgi:glutamate synthase (NADPH/NADH) large chain
MRPAHSRLAVGGEYLWRRAGEPHLFDPETVFRLQHSTRSGRYDVFRQYTERVDSASESLMTLRGLFGFAEGVREPVPLDEVEPVGEIVKRFSIAIASVWCASAAGRTRARGERTPTACSTPSGAAPSSRSRRAASA